MTTIITGIKPTGIPHLGNYIGSIKPAIELSKTADKTLLFIADLHALNGGLDAKEINKFTYYIALAIIESGIDLDKVALFKQSDIPEVHQLAMYLMNVTGKGVLNRAHSYKDKMAKNLENGRDPDANVNMGLYTYPILMAADILLYGSDKVPVGKDQKQHLDIARDLANSFNHIYGDIFTIPEAIISANGDMIPGIDGQKMSKSYNNTISMFATEQEIDKLCRKIKTDSKGGDEAKDAESLPIFQIYKHFGDANQFKNDLENGMGYGDAKKQLSSVLNSFNSKYRDAYLEFQNDPSQVEAILNNGAEIARQLASDKLSLVKKAMLGS